MQMKSLSIDSLPICSSPCWSQLPLFRPSLPLLPFVLDVSICHLKVLTHENSLHAQLSPFMGYSQHLWPQQEPGSPEDPTSQQRPQGGCDPYLPGAAGSPCPVVSHPEVPIRPLLSDFAICPLFVTLLYHLLVTWPLSLWMGMPVWVSFLILPLFWVVSKSMETPHPLR